MCASRRTTQPKVPKDSRVGLKALVQCGQEEAEVKARSRLAFFLSRVEVLLEPADDAPDNVQLVLAFLDAVSFPWVGDQLRLHSQCSEGYVHLDALGCGDTPVLRPVEDQGWGSGIADVPYRGPFHSRPRIGW